MEESEALKILVKLLERNALSEPEKEALKHAIGVLSWTKLRKGAVESIKRRKKRVAS